MMGYPLLLYLSSKMSEEGKKDNPDFDYIQDASMLLLNIYFSLKFSKIYALNFWTHIQMSVLKQNITVLYIALQGKNQISLLLN